MPQPEIFSIIWSRERLGKTGSNTPIGICRALPRGGSLSFSECMSLTRVELTFGAAIAAATRLMVVRNFRRPGDLGPASLPIVSSNIRFGNLGKTQDCGRPARQHYTI